MAKASDITGLKYGKLTAVRFVGLHQSPSRAHRLWECDCECGNKVTVRINSLRTGTVQSCGCLRGAKIKHGMIHIPEYHSWAHMKSRCYKESCKDYKYYGARGIKVCESWLDSFANFMKDMGPRPSASHSIDRIDSNGNYEPMNCRWATPEVQSKNRRNTKYYKGVTSNGS